MGMANRTNILLTVAIGLIVFASAARAQDEQWLQYHSRREALRFSGAIRTAAPRMRTDKPRGVELPQFTSRQQLFTQWSTPMVASGRLHIALDQTSDRGRWDRLFIDSDGDGHLSDETAVAAYRTERHYTHFGPVKVVFQGEDGPIVYHLNFTFYDDGQQDRRLRIHSGCWYEGDITVAGAKRRCVLMDQNVNGTFDDKSLAPEGSDRIRIGEKSGRGAGYVGNYINVDGVMYRLKIARDGAYVMLRKAEDVNFGNVRLPEAITEFSANGENGLLTVRPEKGKASLPVGKYRVYYWVIERKGDLGRLWKLIGSSPSDRASFEINHAKQAELSIGEPVVASVRAQIAKGTYSFNQELKGRFGERIELTRTAMRPRPPKLHIKSKDGKYDRTFSFEYG